MYNKYTTQVALSGECLGGKGPPDRMLAKPWRCLFLAAYTLWAKNLVVAAVLREGQIPLGRVPRNFLLTSLTSS